MEGKDLLFEYNPDESQEKFDDPQEKDIAKLEEADLDEEIVEGE